MRYNVFMSDIRFSVVLPAYGVQNFIAQALDGLLAQTYRDFEVIVVEDGSPDRTGDIAESYRTRFAEAGVSFSLLRKERNEGVSAARNTGMEAASGDYILFLDPDDLYEPRLLETAAAALASFSADVLLYGYTEDYYDGAGRLSYQIKKAGLQGKFCPPDPAYAALLTELEKETMLGYPWNKAYRLEFLRKNGIAFRKIDHIEDILFNLDAAGVAKRYLVLPEALYHYRNQGQARLTGKELPQYFSLQKQRIEAFLDLQEKLQETERSGLSARTLETAANFYFRSFMSMMTRGLERGMRKDEVVAAAKEEAGDPLYLLLKDRLSKEGKTVRFLYLPLARGRFAEAARRAALICRVKARFPVLFARMKQMR